MSKPAQDPVQQQPRRHTGDDESSSAVREGVRDLRKCSHRGVCHHLKTSFSTVHADESQVPANNWLWQILHQRCQLEIPSQDQGQPQERRRRRQKNQCRCDGACVADSVILAYAHHRRRHGGQEDQARVLHLPNCKRERRHQPKSGLMDHAREEHRFDEQRLLRFKERIPEDDLRKTNHNRNQHDTVDQTEDDSANEIGPAEPLLRLS
mmetsp:Transcript_36948/g.88976  ORF Transcript_36948/g.88976 Transcript_36948/m.88976 type:complete len:208 (+) Transcript_36948:211-834(+)